MSFVKYYVCCQIVAFKMFIQTKLTHDKRFIACNLNSSNFKCFKRHKHHVDGKQIQDISAQSSKSSLIKHMFYQEIQPTAPEKSIDVGVSNWMVPVCTNYLQSVFCEFKENNYEDTFHHRLLHMQIVDHNTIPHIISNNSQQSPNSMVASPDLYIVLACVKGLHDQKRWLIHRQIAFRIRHRTGLPSMITLQTHGDDTFLMHPVIKINGVTVLLTDIRGNDEFSEMYMGTNTSYKHFSYVPEFKKLFSTKHGNISNQMVIEIKFDWDWTSDAEQRLVEQGNSDSKPNKKQLTTVQHDFHIDGCYAAVYNTYLYRRDFGELLTDPQHKICCECRKNHGVLVQNQKKPLSNMTEKKEHCKKD